MWDEVGKLRAYHGDVPMEVRLLKLTEEVGEVADAFLGVHRLNKRKGVCGSRDDLLAELADVIITAAVACYRPRYLNIQRLNYLWTIRHSSARIAGSLIT